MSVKVVEKKNFDKPLGLIGFRRVQAPFDANGEILIEKQTIQVPGGTAWVCFEGTDVDMYLVPTDQNTSRYLNRLSFKAIVDDLSPPHAQVFGKGPND